MQTYKTWLIAVAAFFATAQLIFLMTMAGTAGFEEIVDAGTATLALNMTGLVLAIWFYQWSPENQPSVDDIGYQGLESQAGA